MRAAAAGTGRPACASTTISAFCRRKVDLPAMFGPVSSSTRRSGDRSQSFGTKAAVPASAASTTGCRPASIVELVVIGHDRPAPGAALGAAAPPIAATSSKASASAQAGRAVGLRPAPLRTRWANTARSRAAARSPASLMRRSSSDSSGVREAGAVGHALAQRQFREVAQLLDRGGRGLDDVAELRVVADLQAGDAVALRVVELQRRRSRGGCRRAARDRASSSASKPGRIAPPSSSRAGAGSASAARQQSRRSSGSRLRERGAGAGRATAGSGPSSAAAAACGGAPARRAGRRDRAGRRGSATAGPARAACRARRAAPARSAAAASRVGEQPGPGVLPRGDRRRVGQRRRRASRPAGARRAGGQRALHRGEQRVLRAAVAGAQDFQAGARRRVHRQRAGLPCGDRAARAAAARPACVART